MNGCSPSTPGDPKKANRKLNHYRRECVTTILKKIYSLHHFFSISVAVAHTVCDPVIEEHFRRSLGENYKDTEQESNSVSITGSVDDHFAKALGDTWLQIKAKGGGQRTPEADP